MTSTEERKKNPSFFRTFLVYGLGTVGRRLVGILLIPIYTRALSPSDYGITSLIGVFSSVYLNLADLGISTSIFRFYLREKDDAGRKQVMSACLALLALMAVPSLITAAASPLISKSLLNDARWWVLVVLSLGASYADLLTKVPFAPIRAKERSGLYVIINSTMTAATLVVSIIMVVIFRMGPLGVILAHTVVNALGAIYLLIKHVPWPLPRPSRRMMRSVLRYGIPFVPSGISQFVLNLSDRYVLKIYETLTTVGLYSIGYRLGEGLSMASNAFRMAWVPFAFRVAHEEDGRQRLADVGATWYGITILMAVPLSLFSLEALKILTRPAYYGAAQVVPVVAIGLAMFSFYPVAEIALQISGKTAWIPMVNLPVAALNIALNFLLIPRMHMMGAAWATSICYGAQFIIILWLGRRTFVIPFPFGRMLISSLVALAAGIAGIQADRHLSPGLALPIKIVLFAVVVGMIFSIRLVSVARIRRLTRAIRKPRSAEA
jgi:O-antigen/teichoic acid export membrane protein